MQQFIINTLKILKIHLIFIDRMLESTVRVQLKNECINTIYSHTIFCINIRLCQAFFEVKLYCFISHFQCHASIPDPTQMADPNRVRDAKPYTRTLYLFFFFSKPNLYLWVWPTSYNRIKILYTYTKLYLYIYKSERGTYCDEPLLVCWPNCMQKIRLFLLYLHGLKTRAKLYA